MAAKDFQSVTHLPISTDAVSHATGGANPAFSVGSADLFINPALLGLHDRRELQFSNSVDLVSHRFISLAYAFPLSPGDHLAIGLQGLTRPGHGIYRSQENRIINLDDYRLVALVGYSRNLSRLSLGASLQYGREEIYRRSRYFISNWIKMNLGLWYRMKSSFRIGITWYNVGHLDGGKASLRSSAANIRVGLYYAFPSEKSERVELLFSLNGDDRDVVRANAGLVVTPLTNPMGFPTFKIRAGLGNVRFGNRQPPSDWESFLLDRPTLSLGAGIGINLSDDWQLEIDYCFQVIEYVSDQHSISTRLTF